MQDVMIGEREIIHLYKDSGHLCAIDDKTLDEDLAAPGPNLGFAANFLGNY